ncbi:MAG: serine hydrolase domain-containing protein [Gammaproteobacteria bacterium]|jgi:CubicO group peptidase (beta-lactamase class C family)
MKPRTRNIVPIDITRRETLLALVGTGLALAGARAVSAAPSDKAAAARAAADEHFAARMASEHIPGLAVAVLRGPRLMWSRGYGWADLERRLPMTPDTIQNIGSVSKTFTATAAMQLIDAGRLGLDDDINRHLGFEVVHPGFRSQPITVRHLLTHQSAIADGPAYANAYACGDPQMSLEEWLRAYLLPGGRFHDARNFHGWAPGKGFYYANVPYGVLGHLVERISGLPFAEYCRRRIFMPLGMGETSWYLRDIDTARHAIPYSWVSGGAVRGPVWGGVPPSVVGDPGAATRIDGGYAANCLYNHPNFPDGFLRSSVHQLARYARAYLDAAAGADRPLLQAQTIRQMFRIESGDDSRVMGLCWNAQRRSGRDLLWGHGGSDPGINANLRLRFEDGVAAIVLMNTNVGRPPLPAPLEFAEYLMDHSSELLADDPGSA